MKLRPMFSKITGRIAISSTWYFVKKYRFILLAVFAVFVVLLCIPFRTTSDYDDPSKTYIVTDGKETHVYEGVATESLSFSGFEVVPSDEEHDSRFLFEKGQDIIVRHGDIITEAKTENETVTQLLKRLDIEVAEGEMIAINLGGLVPIVHVDSTLTYTHNEYEQVECNTKYFPNYLLAYEEINTIQEGQDGEVTITYEDTYQNGQLIDSRLVGRTDATTVTKIVEYGTLVKEVDRDDTLKEVHYFHNSTGGYLVFTSGFSMTFSDSAVCSATAYYGGTITATGHSVGVGIIAADPKVYKYHSRMYIKCVNGSREYGIGQVEDCGGAVKGHTVDLWFPTYGDCVNWGRRNVMCYLLD